MAVETRDQRLTAFKYQESKICNNKSFRIIMAHALLKHTYADPVLLPYSVIFVTQFPSFLVEFSY